MELKINPFASKISMRRLVFILTIGTVPIEKSTVEDLIHLSHPGGDQSDLFFSL